ncbi:hypothetical protein ELE18_06615 [Klebsiella quasipneumoniae]|nr:hypothetical protein BME54_07410 [Klebsiella quasipneumoniae]AZJ26774.1 hypothetical protein BME36_007300 [Klebsiella quasipneumoniae subsp. similipneumoniae]AZR62058.1 hypothetical protein ELE18_06615 [Klebsiella quasipneumoniae]KAA6483198.1 hypothetical protein EHW95_25405 [Klebsiella quasipneumoniae]QFU63335.1 hypothetical protein EQH50_00190 [Klebsiella quasipneumoniae]
MSNNASLSINGFLFRIVMQILHVVTATAESVKEPFTTQGYFLKMHLKYIIKITPKEAHYARRSNHRYGQSHHPSAGRDWTKVNRPFLRSDVRA